MFLPVCGQGRGRTMKHTGRSADHSCARRTAKAARALSDGHGHQEGPWLSAPTSEREWKGPSPGRLQSTLTHRWACTIRAQRMGTLSKSVCKLLLLSPWISQQESDVSVVQAQGGLSKACLPGLGISTLPTLGSSDILLFPCPLRSPQRLSQSPL